MQLPTTVSSIEAPLMSRWLVMLFACASGISVANVYFSQPLLDSLADNFGVSHAAIGSVITATQLGSVLALMLVVPLGDVMNRRRLMLIQLGALVLALVGVSMASSSLMLLICMLFVGLLGTAMTQGLIAYAATAAAPSERGRVVGAAQGGVVIGLLMARVQAGFIADLAGWRAVYWFSAVVMLTLGVVLWRGLPKQNQTSHSLSYKDLIVSMFVLLRDERVLQIRGVIALLMFAAFSIFWSALVLPLSEPPYGFSHAAIGAFGLVGAVGALAAARTGHWADSGLAQLTSCVGLSLMLLSWIPLWYTTQSLWWLVVGILMLDLGGQTIHVTNQSMIFSTTSHAHSRLVGCYMLFYSVGSGLGAIASTAIYARAGWSGVCILGAVTSGLAFIFWLMTMKLTKTIQ